MVPRALKVLKAPGCGFVQSVTTGGAKLRKGRRRIMGESVETAKQVIQELNGLLKDAKQVSREIKEGREALRLDVTSVSMGIARGCIKVVGELLAQHVAEVSEALDASNAGILEQAAKLAGMESPDEFVSAVVAGVAPIVIDALKESLGRAAEGARADATALVVTVRESQRHGNQRKKRLPPAVVTSVLKSPPLRIGEQG